MLEQGTVTCLAPGIQRWTGGQRQENTYHA